MIDNFIIISNYQYRFVTNCRIHFKYETLYVWTEGAPGQYLRPLTF